MGKQLTQEERKKLGKNGANATRLNSRHAIILKKSNKSKGDFYDKRGLANY